LGCRMLRLRSYLNSDPLGELSLTDGVLISLVMVMHWVSIPLGVVSLVSHRMGLNCLSRPTPHYLFPGPIYPEIPETNRLGPRNWGLFLGGFRGVYGGYPRGSNLGVFLTPDLGVRGPPILGPARGRGCTIWRVFNNSPSRDKMGHFHFRVFRMIPHYTEN